MTTQLAPPSENRHVSLVTQTKSHSKISKPTIRVQLVHRKDCASCTVHPLGGDSPVRHSTRVIFFLPSLKISIRTNESDHNRMHHSPSPQIFAHLARGSEAAEARIIMHDIKVTSTRPFTSPTSHPSSRTDILHTRTEANSISTTPTSSFRRSLTPPWRPLPQLSTPVH